MTTPGGLLLVLAVLVPFVGVLAGLVFGGRNAQRLALLITGIVVAFSATALAVALLLRLHDETGSVTLSCDAPATPDADAPDAHTILPK